MQRKKVAVIILSILTLLIVVTTSLNHKNVNPQSVYQVYLDGEVIGLVKDKDELLNLINDEQQDIKDKYKVNEVYPPNGFNIEEYITYDNNITSANNVYKKIQEKSDFTIKGYVITITRAKTESEAEKVTKIYVLDDQIYYEAEQNFIHAFVDEGTYNAYITNTQSEIKDVGSIIKHMEFGETVTVKQVNISTKEKIFTDADELTQYLLYGKTDATSTYTVKKGDTLASIASASKLNVQELIIANPKFRSSNAVLAIGDKVKNSLIDPILTLYEEVRVTEDIEQAYTKKTVTDNTMAYNTTKVTQTGITGLERVTQEIRIINGERAQDSNVISSVTIRQSVDEITSVGPKYTPTTTWGSQGKSNSVINTGLSWSWPTKTPYIITTDYEYRWGSFHDAIDISGTGFGSPIYAARAGEVVEVYTSCANYGWYGSMCGGSYGNYIIIRHDNNYYTMYAHLKSDLLVSVGSHVSQGQQIGYMGSSGSSTGTHLHFGFSVGYPHHGGTWYSPWSLYR